MGKVTDGIHLIKLNICFLPGDYSGMNFTWICYLSGESFSVDEVSSLQDVYPDGSPPTLNGDPVTPQPSGGCFNTGPGKVNAPLDSHTITFNNSLMKVGNTYYIVLMVTKDQRVATYSQIITIAEAPPPFNLRYEIRLGRCFLIMHNVLDSSDALVSAQTYYERWRVRNLIVHAGLMPKVIHSSQTIFRSFVWKYPDSHAFSSFKNW